ncbi:MAG TPA: hypothetical protein VMY77_02030 [Chitinophagaceae bacterium]|nr:hypothetical protein [Chitinophagaceae bacterium]
MKYNEDDIRSYCGFCKETFSAEVYYCPGCGSNLVNYNTAMRTEELAVQDRWERHHRGFKRDRNGKGKEKEAVKK